MPERPATLIVFCREPIAGGAKTRLARRLGPDGAAGLASAFIADTLAKCRALAPAPIVIAATAAGPADRSPYFRALARRFAAKLIDQGGGSLGARMARVLKPFSESGAVLLGTDTPSLPAGLLRRSIALLGRAPVVIGPSLDGGYYLVGVRGPMPDIFRAIRWGRAGVLGETIARLERDKVRYLLGPAWYDVDRWSDVELLTMHLERMLDAGAARRSGCRRSAAALACPATARILRRLGLLRAGR